MPRRDGSSLWDSLSGAGLAPERGLIAVDQTVRLSDLVTGSSLGGRLQALRGRSVLVATDDQLTAALALIELDGVARRLVLCPPDLALEHLPTVAAIAEADALVTQRVTMEGDRTGLSCHVVCSPEILLANPDRHASEETEWVLLTSGTTGQPKLMVHTLVSLAGPARAADKPATPPIWSTFYDIRRYGGLQILLRALLGGGSLVLSSRNEAIGDFLNRAGAHGVTHISGTPSHWRRALMSPQIRALAPRCVRLSGEIADQAVLDSLRATFPDAAVEHAFASTEAGVAFAVADVRAGFPASFVGMPGEVELKVENGSLRVRSSRMANRCLGTQPAPLRDQDGFIDTGDMVELGGDRYYFVGRRDGTINVGGLKVHPEEVEAVINRHPGVRMSRVRGRRNPITGAIVVADVVAKSSTEGVGGSETLKSEILAACQRALPPHKVPVRILFVASLDVTGSGKLARVNA